MNIYYKPRRKKKQETTYNSCTINIKYFKRKTQLFLMSCLPLVGLFINGSNTQIILDLF